MMTLALYRYLYLGSCIWITTAGSMRVARLIAIHASSLISETYQTLYILICPKTTLENCKPTAPYTPTHSNVAPEHMDDGFASC